MDPSPTPPAADAAAVYCGLSLLLHLVDMRQTPAEQQDTALQSSMIRNDNGVVAGHIDKVHYRSCSPKLLAPAVDAVQCCVYRVQLGSVALNELTLLSCVMAVYATDYASGFGIC